MKLCAIASGSKGNCTYIGSQGLNILVDVGISGKQAIRGLDEINIEGTDIDAIFITHEHNDHIKGVGIFSRKFDTPIYATEKTWQVIDTNNMIGKVAQQNKKIIKPNKCIKLNKTEITPFSIKHDSVDPVGYTFETDNKKIAVLTDIGSIDDDVFCHMKNCNGMLVESNHDESILQVGDYPPNLKKRILGEYGHISNETSAQFIADIYNKNLKWVVLGHLSQDNNFPDLAYVTFKNTLATNGIKIKIDIEIYIAEQNKISKLLCV
ncbi:MAG: MBL fold metallo-hydrolase [Epulopiscium sp. Nele67-Bin004]|nr:MAG: MBL fold metallo-hydrolase [Epulopiscium sp. Nele67-Bin004]